MNARGIRRLCLIGALAPATLAAPASRASDHADPMSLNVFAVPKEQEANITDLHAFVVDGEGRPLPARDAAGKLITVADPFAGDRRLIISLCVRRALNAEDSRLLDLQPYTYRVHLDLAPPVRFVDPDASTGRITGVARDEIQNARSMQVLYGGMITQPEDIVETAMLEFRLGLSKKGVPYLKRDETRAWGFRGPHELTVRARPGQPGPDEMAITTGVFDDPFIFPRFFRRSVVAVVASIPISSLMQTPPPGPVPILLWATTHKGNRQIDHVGRSLRTQLPRFGYLNEKRPSDHVRAIARVHAEPTILEALLGSIVAPLFAHRHYDSVPDVMVYDLRKPALFPNGRWLEDDVAQILANAGETLLFELSYAESRESPRATRDDKAFLSRFPYLAKPWTSKQILENQDKGTEVVPRAPDPAATAPPGFDDSIWLEFFWLEVGSIGALTVALLFTLRGLRLRIALVLVALLATALLWRVHDPNLAGPLPGLVMQTAQKLERLALGVVLIGLLGVGWIFALGRRSAARPPASGLSFPRDRQGPIEDDAKTRSYEEIHAALFDPSVCRPYYKVWGDPAQRPLPIYRTSFASITEGLLALRDGAFALEQAARRTLRTRGDLRWGADRNGFRRLVHPMGVCLAGTWEIDAAPADTNYTGYFAPGARGRVIARYSLGGNHAEGGHFRSLGLVGKVFPPEDAPLVDTPRAHFITQEDLGGAFTHSVTEALLTNSPPVTLLNRGSGLFAFLAVIVALRRSDVQPSERQLYEIAELEKPEGVQTSCPRFMRLTIDGPKRDVGDEQIDFRHEILGTIYDPGLPQPKRKLVFAIEVSDQGRRTLFQRVVGQSWTRIGTLTFQEAAASYNGDFVVHFHHPPWRKDRNDPDSVRRRDLRSSRR